MPKHLALLAAALFALVLSHPPAAQDSFDQEAYEAWARDFLDNLHPQEGRITLADARVTLNVPEGFYYLSSEETSKVLVEAWGNPPEASQSLGMLMPGAMTPLDDYAWGIIIEYEEDGYVSDADAGTIDYGELLSSMKRDTAEASEAREEMGYDSIELVGWAEPPYYDAATNRLHWAKELKFGGHDFNTLNYDIRILGRKGVVVMSFVATMDQLARVKAVIPKVLNSAEFDEGYQYADFNPDIDQVAAYGIGALIAGKVLTKTGFAAAAILLVKKFGAYILIGLGALGAVLFKRFARN